MAAVFSRCVAVVMVPTMVMVVMVMVTMAMLLCARCVLGFCCVHVGHRGSSFWNCFMKEWNSTIDWRFRRWQNQLMLLAAVVHLALLSFL